MFNTIKVHSINDAKEEISIRKKQFPRMIHTVEVDSSFNLKISSIHVKKYIASIKSKYLYGR
jgi:hypothetical protein